MKHKWEILGFLSLALCFTAQAAPAPDTSEAAPATTITNLPALPRSKKAKKLGRAYDLLQDDKFSEARTQIASLTNDLQFADIAIGITADAYLKEAQIVTEAGNYKDAAPLAVKLIAQEMKLQLNYPFSAYARSFSKNVGLGELIQADLAWSQKKWAEVLILDSRAFERFSAHSSVALVPASSIAHYRDACSKQTNEFCKLWLLKFLNTIPRQGEAAKEIAKTFPDLLVAGRPPH